MQEQEYEVAILVSNTHDTNFTLALEPWGFVYEMSPQASYTVVFRSLVQPVPPNIVEVEYGANNIIIYGWDGCLFAVYHNGEVLSPGAFQGPRLPDGVNIIKNLGFLKETLNTSRPIREENKEEKEES
jgi:hypothetical protein